MLRIFLYLYLVAIGVVTYAQNLTIAVPSNWEAPIHVSNQAETLTTDVNFTEGELLFLDVGFRNESVTTLEAVDVQIRINGRDFKKYFWSDLAPSGFGIALDNMIALPSGEITISIHIDPDNQIAESNENDNSYSLTVQVAEAQDKAFTHDPIIKNIEYFIGDDPGYGHGIPVAFTLGEDSVISFFNSDLSTIPTGFNTLSVRAQNLSGTWGITESVPVYNKLNADSSLALLEYYIDTDPGLGNGTMVPLAVNSREDTLAFVVPLNEVSPGFHQLFIRAKASNNAWSIVENVSFFNLISDKTNIERIEYFVDNDPGVGSATEISSSGTTDEVSFTVPLTNLTPGFHQLFIRAKSANGGWSPLESRGFFVEPGQGRQADIVRLEYFYVGPEGRSSRFGYDIPQPSTAVDLIAPLDISSLVDGSDYTLNVIAINQMGVRSFLSKDNFTFNFNLAPKVIGTIGDLQILEDSEQMVIFADVANIFADPDGDSLVYSLDYNEDNLSLSIENSQLLLTPVEDYFGNESVIVRASDGEYDVEITFTVTVSPVNDAPTFTLDKDTLSLIEDFSGEEVVTIIPGATPANESQQSVTYSLEPATIDFASISMNSSSGELSISSIEGGVGQQKFEIIADDGQQENNLFSQSFFLEIADVNNDPVLIDSISDIVVEEGFVTKSVILSTNFSDPDGDSLRYSASSENPAVVTVSLDGDVLTLTEVNPGVSLIEVSVTDGLGGSISEIFSVTVREMQVVPLQVVETTPESNQTNITPDSNISINFDSNISQSSVDGGTSGDPTDDAIQVAGQQSGLISGVYSGNGTGTITFDPNQNFNPGEIITVTITNKVLGTEGEVGIPFTFQFTVKSQSGPGLFPSKSNITTTTEGVKSVFPADVDGDGDLDLLTASTSDNQISFYENDGGNNFTEIVISMDAGRASSVYAADLDGDSDLDILGASSDDDKISWYQNDGNQNFTEKVISTTADAAFAVYAADINSDGKMDVVSASSGDDKIAWYENNGNESFTERVISTNADGVRSLHIADLDNDGDLDVLSSLSAKSEVVWYENDSNQVFLKHVISDRVNLAFSVFATDLDTDGDMDVISASLGDDEITWFENDGQETFRKRTISDRFDGVSIVRAADLDGDGDVDILANSFTAPTGRVTWFENDGNENFNQLTIHRSEGIIDDLMTADLDEDGDLDVISVSVLTSSIGLHKQVDTMQVIGINPSGSSTNFPAGGNITFEFSADVSQFSVDGGTPNDPTDDAIRLEGQQTGLIRGEYTGDGTNTIVFDPQEDFKAGEIIQLTITNRVLGTEGKVSIPSTYQFSTATQSGSGLFPHPENKISTNSIAATAVYAADLDEDGDVDVLSTSGLDDKISWYENDGNTNFTERVISTSADVVSTIHVADVDSDGDLDVLSKSSSDFRIAWYENDGNAVFTERMINTSSLSPIIGLTSIYAADMDGDGDVDVLTASDGDSKIACFENDGTQFFVERVITTGAIGAMSVFAADVDSDGDLDVLSASFGDNKIIWYENFGNNIFSPRLVSTDANGANSVYASDLDGDGDMDIFSASAVDDKIAWYENDGNEVFDERVISTNALGPKSVYVADVDGDEDLDVLSASFVDDKIAWFVNDGNQVFTERIISNSADFAESVYAADLDGDGDLDVLSASLNDNKIAWYEQAEVSVLAFNSKISQVIEVYPNPTKSNLWLRIGNGVEIDNGILLTDVAGRKQSIQWHRLEDGVIEIVMKSLPTGVYFLELSLDQEVHQIKVLKE